MSFCMMNTVNQMAIIRTTPISDIGSGYTKYFYDIYTILLFLTSGELTLSNTQPIGYLCVGGGAGGGLNTTFGGGGGYAEAASYSRKKKTLQINTKYIITVGNGGSGTNNSTPPTASTIDSLLSCAPGTTDGNSKYGIFYPYGTSAIALTSGAGGTSSSSAYATFNGVPGGDGFTINIPEINLSGKIAAGGGGSMNSSNVGPYGNGGPGGAGGGGGGASRYKTGGLAGTTGLVTFGLNKSLSFGGIGSAGDSGGTNKGGIGAANTGSGGGANSGIGGSGVVLIWYPT